MVVDREANTAEYGVGGGIVWDSDAADEYEECKAKAAVLLTQPQTFDLLETMLWEPAGGIYLLEAHVNRMVDSARHFGIPVSAQALLDSFRSFTPADPSSRSSAIRIEERDIKSLKGARVGLASHLLPAASPNIFHKTTERQFYARMKASLPDLQDVLLWTPDGQVTESTLANVVVRMGSEWVTPRASIGLLPGVLRANCSQQASCKRGRSARTTFCKPRICS